MRITLTTAALTVALAGCGGDDGGTTTATFKVPSITMTPTLEMGDTIKIDPEATPEPGDIVGFYDSEGALSSECGTPVEDGQLCATAMGDKSAVRQVLRVAAGPGDKIAMPAGHLVVNGKRVRESNRAGAIDSRKTGPVPTDWIVGVRR